jgi:hypothetical protein
MRKTSWAGLRPLPQRLKLVLGRDLEIAGLLSSQIYTGEVDCMLTCCLAGKKSRIACCR